VQYNDFACAAELFLWTVIIGMGGRIESERVDDLIGIRRIVLFFALMRIAINLMTDVLYVWIDPRIKNI